MKLRELFNTIIQLDDNEWNILQNLLKERSFKKGEFLVSEGKVENYINLIVEGSCRVYYMKNGIEYNYIIALEDDWISSYKSFTANMPSDENIQAMTNMKVYSVHRDSIKNLASLNLKFSILERYIVNQIINDKTERLRSFVSDTPEERYLKLLKKKPNVVQNISLKFLASYIGITAESLSRMRKRLLQKKNIYFLSLVNFLIIN
ncbi:MAG: Crp/Fnr family transcriptional regulator [Flavobacteriia bacterium]